MYLLRTKSHTFPIDISQMWVNMTYMDDMGIYLLLYIQTKYSKNRQIPCPLFEVEYRGQRGTGEGQTLDKVTDVTALTDGPDWSLE